MPQAVAGAIITAVGATGAAAVAIQLVVYVAFSVGLNALQRSMTKKDRGQDAIVMREMTQRGTVLPRQVILGQVKSAGMVVWQSVGGTNGQELYTVVAFAAHQCAAMDDIWLDGRRIVNSSIDGFGQVQSSEFLDGSTPKLKLWKHLGTSAQAADTQLYAAGQVPEWNSTFTGAGICYVVLVMVANNTVWSSGAPQNVYALIKGAKCYDPRKDGTNGGSGTHRYTDATTWEWSNNPALHARWYATGGSVYNDVATPLKFLGMVNAIPDSRIDDAHLITQANVCDESVTVPLLGYASPGVSISNTFKTATKTTGTGWTTSAFCPEPFSTIDLRFTLADITNQLMVGLDEAPGEGTGYDTIAFAWHYSTADGALAIYENGTKISNHGSYTVGSTVLRIDYDGTNVRYYKDATLIRTTTASGELYITSSLQAIGASFTITNPTSATQKRYTSDTQLSMGDTHQANLEKILSACLGKPTLSQGKWRFHVGAYSAPSITLTQHDIVGDMDMPTETENDKLYNFVTGTFYDDSRGWALSNFPSVTQSTYQTDDGQLLTKTLELPATRNTYRAQRIAKIMLEQSRNKFSLSLKKVTPKALQIAEYDNFYLTIPELAFTAQPFKVLSWEFQPDGYIAMTCQIESSSAYNDPALTDYQVLSGTSDGGLYVQAPTAPTGLTLVGVPGAVIAAVALGRELQAGEIVQLYEHTSSTPFSAATLVDEGSKVIFSVAHRDTTTRYYWSRTKYKGQYSDTYPASTGTAGASDLVATSDADDEMATSVYTTYGAGPFTLSNIA